MSGRSARQKGARWERKLANELRAMGFDAKRSIQARGASDGADVEAMIEGGRLLIECKHHKKVPWRAAHEQSENHPKEPGDLTACCCKDNGKPPVWLLPEETMQRFLELLKERAPKPRNPNAAT